MPDLKRQLMIMYDVFIASSIFLLGSLIASMANTKLNISLALLMIFQLMILQGLYKKFCFRDGDKSKKILIAIFLHIVVIPFICLFSEKNLVIVFFYEIFSIAALFFTRSINISIFTYDEYVFRIKLWNIINLCFMIGISFLDETMKSQCMVIFMEGILVSIVLLRKSRNYDNGIKSKNDKWFNLSIIIMAIISFNEWFNNFCQNIGNSIRSILEKVFYGVTAIVGTPLAYITEKIRQYINPVHHAKTLANEAPVINNLEDLNFSENKILESIITVLKSVGQALLILAAILLILIIARTLIKAIKRSLNIHNEIRDPSEEYFEIEKIENIKQKKKKFKFSIEGEGNKSKVRRIYVKFLNLAREKTIYKSFLTPTALANQMKTSIDAPKELDIIKDIYNEGKFSNHEVTGNMVDDMENAYKVVRSKTNKK